ncbi:MAG: hypothetical protein N4A64_05710 [Marinisporobacter sp.]|jgi:hypothetical protein|nr:hypothetical protein [Marinisporobacter sp.]
MGAKLENSIEISGNIEEFPYWSENFKQVHIQKTSYLGKKDPNIKEFLRTSVKPEVIHTKIIKTSIGRSQENQILTGFNLIVEGKLTQNLEYIPKDTLKSVHVTQLYIPFSTCIVLGKAFDYYSKLKVIPYVEDLYVRRIMERKIFQSILLTLDVTQLS